MPGAPPNMTSRRDGRDRPATVFGNYDSSLSETVPRGIVRMFGTNFDNLTLAQAGDLVEGLVARRDGPRVVCVKDVALTIRCQESEFLTQFYRRADAMFVDGRGLYYASRLLGLPLRDIVGGPGLYFELIRRAADKGHRVYVLGANRGTLQAAMRNATTRHPALRIVGSHDGYFASHELTQIGEEIRASEADIVFVGITTPKREETIEHLRKQQISTVLVAIGGVLDVEAGEKRLAPRWISHLGMEWFYRASQEPRRLFPRYLRTHSRFLLLLAREMFRSRRDIAPH